jgi:hypothetical protein
MRPRTELAISLGQDGAERGGRGDGGELSAHHLPARADARVNACGNERSHVSLRVMRDHAGGAL